MNPIDSTHNNTLETLLNELKRCPPTTRSGTRKYADPTSSNYKVHFRGFCHSLRTGKLKTDPVDNMTIIRLRVFTGVMFYSDSLVDIKFNHLSETEMNEVEITCKDEHNVTHKYLCKFNRTETTTTEIT